MIVSLVGFATALGSGPAMAAPNGVSCTPAVHSWAGRVDVEAGASFHTGVIVSTQIGVQLVVGSSDVSTDEPAPGQLSLTIGDSPVIDGATVVGGEIVVTNAGLETVVLTRVEISLDECTQVEVAPPLPPVLGLPVLRTDLPATGSPGTARTAVAAAMLIGTGGALLMLRRRPRRACRPVTGHGPGR